MSDPSTPVPRNTPRGKVWKIPLLLLCATGTVGLGVLLVFLSGDDDAAPRSFAARVRALGALFGAIAGFWIWSCVSLVLIHSLLSGEGEGPRRRGFAFMVLFLLAALLLLGGVATIIFGVAINSTKDADVAMLIRAGGLALLGCSALALLMAFGRSRGTRTRLKAVVVEEDVD